MEEKAFEYIDAIAANLGVAAEHVYGAMLKQAMVSGVTSIVWTIIMATATIVSVIILVRMLKSMPIDEDVFGIALIGVLLVTVFSIFTVINIQSASTALLNPEYWALKEILDTIKGAE